MKSFFSWVGWILASLFRGIVLGVVFVGVLYLSDGVYSGVPAFLVTLLLLIYFVHRIKARNSKKLAIIFKLTPAFLVYGLILWAMFPLPQHEFPALISNPLYENWDLGNNRIISVYKVLPSENVTPKNETIVFVHGGPGAYNRDFDLQFITEFAHDGYQILTYDQIGAGRSGLVSTQNYSHQANVDDLKSIMHRIDTPIILFGQSYGAGIVTSFLDQYESEFDVKKVILSEPSPLPGFDPNDDDPKYAEKTSKMPNLDGPNMFEVMANPRLILGLTLPDQNQFVDQIEIRNFIGPDVQSQIVRTSYCAGQEEHIQSFEHFPVNLFAMLAIQSDFASAKRPNLKSLEQPVMLLMAECSYIPRGYHLDYFDHFTIARSHYIRNSGHILWGTKAGREITASVIRSFLNNTEPPLENIPTPNTLQEFLDAGM